MASSIVDAALWAVGASSLEIDPPFIEAIDHLHAAALGFFMPCARKACSHSPRGAICARTGFPSAFAKAAAMAFGVVRSAASSSTIRCPVHVSRSKSAAMQPTSWIETMGTGRSSGCR